MQHRPELVPHESFAFAAEPPPFPDRRRGDGGVLDYVVSAELREHRDNTVVLSGTTREDESVSVRLAFVTAGVVRVLLEREDSTAERFRLARGQGVQSLVELRESRGSLELFSEDIRVRAELDPFSLVFFDGTGHPLLVQNPTETNVADQPTGLPFGFSRAASGEIVFHDSFTAEPDEHFYGLGEKFTDLDKRGQRIEMWHYDAYGVHTERAYKNVPFLLSSRGYGIFVDSIRRVNFDIAAGNHALTSIVVPDDALDYYVIAGGLKRAISRYAGLVGLPTLPPKWAFGLWMSSGFQRDSAAAVLKRARQIREHDLPCSVLHLDCYWQRHGRWSEMLWDEEMFPDPEGLVRRVKELGFRVCLWMNPYIGVESERFREADENGYFLKTPANRTYVVGLWGDFHPEVGIVDVTNPEALEWFKDLHRPLLRQGIDVFKTDFGEGVPADARAHNGMSGEELHNLYPLLYNDVVAEVTAEETGRAGMVWGRSTYAGGQRHAAQWGGDPNCTYAGMASTLRGGLSLGACGHPFWSHDIGGFHRQPTPELYVRWAQFGLFSPLSRAHGMTSRLPWEYGEEALEIFRRYTRLRYRLLPYIYSYARLGAETSLPIMRPMFLEFPDDPMTYTLDLQYMLGSELLVAPIYNTHGERPVYFPAGAWIDYWTREIICGPQTRRVEAPLDTLPLYVRADSLIPTAEPQEPLTEEPFDPVTFEAYLLRSARFDLRDTDGITSVAAALRGSELAVSVEGSKAGVGLRLLPLPGGAGVAAVSVNGERLPRTSADLDAESKGWKRVESGALELRYVAERRA